MNLQEIFTADLLSTNQALNNPPNLKVNLIKSFKDPLSRQISEGVYIFKTQDNEDIKLLNSKSEWRQPSLIEMRQDIVRREVGT